MKVLMINKFLHPNGGSETYIFNLGKELIRQGHEVQYFGMEHEKRVVGNRLEIYTNNMDFHNGSKLAKVLYSFKTIYSVEARKKIRKVLDDFKPDVCHINNFNYQLTPSIILEIRKWEKQAKHKCKILYTAHDYQLVCPNHMCNNPNTHENCEKCLNGKYSNCMKGKCIHGSTAKSIIGMTEAYLWNTVKVYEKIDKIICCSEFMKTKLDSNPILASKTIAIHNFVEKVITGKNQKKDYVLYFGRYSEEKGIKTLINVAKELPEVNFIFAGKGPLESEVPNTSNIKNVGFKTGAELEQLIREAKFAVYPSEWYENCPLSIMESQMYGTPVLAADIGGIPELISEGKNGELFESGNHMDLKEKILGMWENDELLQSYSKECGRLCYDDVSEYYKKWLKIVE